MRRKLRKAEFAAPSLRLIPECENRETLARLVRLPIKGCTEGVRMIDPEEEREGFISIRELVVAIASNTGKTEQGAAAMLAASLAKLPEWQRLQFREWSQAYGCFELEEGGKRENQARQRLQRWAESGNNLPGFEDFDDDIPF